MIAPDISNLLNTYLDWYKQKTSFKELKDAHEMVTPFVNHLNDRISLFIEILPNNQIRLSDDGVTLNELSLMALNINTETRQKILSDTLNNFGVKQDGEILYVIATNIRDFAQKKHNIMQCILRIYDLLFTDSHKVKSLFHEEVLEFFFENDFGGNISPKFTGRSGIIHSFDYSIGATKKRPTTLIKFQNKPDFADLASQKFIIEDIENEPSLNHGGVKFAMITGEKDIATKARQVAEEVGVELVHYQDRPKLLQLKAA